jgi:hypothetical protein
MLSTIVGLFGGRLFKYLAVLGAVAAIIFAWTRYTDGLVTEGYERGTAEVRAEVAIRDNRQLEALLAHRLAAEAKVNATEKRAREQMAAQRARHTKEKEDAEKVTEELVAAARAGALVLRDPGAAAAGPAVGDRGPAGADRAAGPGAGPSGGAGLSAKAAEFLLELTALADLEAFRYNRLLSAYRTAEQVCYGE